MYIHGNGSESIQIVKNVSINFITNKVDTNSFTGRKQLNLTMSSISVRAIHKDSGKHEKHLTVAYFAILYDEKNNNLLTIYLTHENSTEPQTK